MNEWWWIWPNEGREQNKKEEKGRRLYWTERQVKVFLKEFITSITRLSVSVLCHIYLLYCSQHYYAYIYNRIPKYLSNNKIMHYDMGDTYIYTYNIRKNNGIFEMISVLRAKGGGVEDDVLYIYLFCGAIACVCHPHGTRTLHDTMIRIALNETFLAANKINLLLFRKDDAFFSRIFFYYYYFRIL